MVSFLCKLILLIGWAPDSLTGFFSTGNDRIGDATTAWYGVLPFGPYEMVQLGPG